MPTVYDTKTGQPVNISQKIYDAMKSQGSVRYSPTSPTSPTFKSTRIQTKPKRSFSFLFQAPRGQRNMGFDDIK